eukprot:ctg_2679.g470
MPSAAEDDVLTVTPLGAGAERDRPGAHHPLPPGPLRRPAVPDDADQLQPTRAGVHDPPDQGGVSDAHRRLCAGGLVGLCGHRLLGRRPEPDHVAHRVHRLPPAGGCGRRAHRGLQCRARAGCRHVHGGGGRRAGAVHRRLFAAGGSASDGGGGAAGRAPRCADQRVDVRRAGARAAARARGALHPARGRSGEARRPLSVAGVCARACSGAAAHSGGVLGGASGAAGHSHLLFVVDRQALHGGVRHLHQPDESAHPAALPAARQPVRLQVRVQHPLIGVVRRHRAVRVHGVAGHAAVGGESAAVRALVHRSAEWRGAAGLLGVGHAGQVRVERAGDGAATGWAAGAAALQRGLHHVFGALGLYADQRVHRSVSAGECGAGARRIQRDAAVGARAGQPLQPAGGCDDGRAERRAAGGGRCGGGGAGGGCRGGRRRRRKHPAPVAHIHAQEHPQRVFGVSWRGDRQGHRHAGQAAAGGGHARGRRAAAPRLQAHSDASRRAGGVHHGEDGARPAAVAGAAASARRVRGVVAGGARALSACGGGGGEGGGGGGQQGGGTGGSAGADSAASAGGRGATAVDGAGVGGVRPEPVSRRPPAGCGAPIAGRALSHGGGRHADRLADGVGFMGGAHRPRHRPGHLRRCAHQGAGGVGAAAHSRRRAAHTGRVLWRFVLLSGRAHCPLRDVDESFEGVHAPAERIVGHRMDDVLFAQPLGGRARVDAHVGQADRPVLLSDGDVEWHAAGMVKRGCASRATRRPSRALERHTRRGRTTRRSRDAADVRAADGGTRPRDPRSKADLAKWGQRCVRLSSDGPTPGGTAPVPSRPPRRRERRGAVRGRVVVVFATTGHLFASAVWTGELASCDSEH